MDRSGHRMGKVDGVSLVLLGAIVWLADGKIEVKPSNGNPSDTIWFGIGENRYTLSYNTSIEQIELKEKTHEGDIFYAFDNTSSYDEIIMVFNRL